MSATEWNRYAQAIVALKNEMRSTTSFGSVSTYDLLVKIHIDNANWVHGYGNFFSWHRRYLREVERHCQRVLSDTTIMIPYWDWTRDSQAPEASPIFTSTYFGSTPNGCVANGKFARFQARFPTSHCLGRQYDAGTRMSAWDSEELVASILVSASGYDDLRQQIEGGGHASIHVNIGGDMSQMRSPNDPIFWSHHGFIDKLWNDWQHQNGWANYWSYSGPNSDGSQAQLTDVMRPWTSTVRNILWTENLGYCYQERSGAPPAWLRRRADDTVPSFIKIVSVNDPLAKPATDDEADALFNVSSDSGASLDGASTGNTSTQGGVSPLDRSNLFKLRYPSEIPEEYLLRNNLDVDRVRSYEVTKRGLCDKLNKLDDYISPCALANHPNLLQTVAEYKDVKKMYGVVNGQMMQVDTSVASGSNGRGYDIAQQVSQAMKNKFGKYLSKSNRHRYMQVINQ
jgi:tyrosinase